MVEVIGIKFYKNGVAGGKLYYFGTNECKVKKGYDVVIETAKGEEIVFVETTIQKIDDAKVVNPLKNIIRVATKKDRSNHQRNNDERGKILAEVKTIATKSLPEMQVINVNYTLNRDQLLIFFVSEGRVDFRELVKIIAAKYRTRIEFRQVGVRDEAKVIGGIGICGRIICCNSYSTDFDSVSISMAKNQSLSLVPSKISGQCGRLLCCLRYEDEEYKILKKGMPKVGSKYVTSEGEGKVVSLNVLLRTFKVFVKGKGIIEESSDGSN